MKKQLVFLTIITMLFSAFLSGCFNNQAEQASLGEKLAVVDLEKILRAHHLYPAWEMAVSTELATQKLKENQIVLVKQQAGFIDKMQDLQQFGQESFYQADFAIKMSEAHLEEREHLKLLERKEKQRIEENLKLRYAAIEEEYKLPMFNLKMKIEAIQPLPYMREQAKEEKEQLIAQLAALQQEKTGKINALHQESGQLLIEAMQEYEQESRERLQILAKNLSKQLSTDSRAQILEKRKLLTNIPEAFDKTMASLEKQLLEQKMTKDRLYTRMYSEISSQITRIAMQKQIDVVLVNVKVNIQAEDITEEVIAALPAK